MNYREKMRKAVSSPYDGSAVTYGEWGALRPDQRAFILRLLDEMDSADAYIKTLYQENQQLKEVIDKSIGYINKYESIKAYYEYEECGYDEYNYDDDFKNELLEILKGEENEERI